MTTLRTTATNVQKLSRLQQVLSDLLDEALQSGFFGTAGLELSVQDGTIQHIRRRVDRIER